MEENRERVKDKEEMRGRKWRIDRGEMGREEEEGERKEEEWRNGRDRG